MVCTRASRKSHRVETAMNSLSEHEASRAHNVSIVVYCFSRRSSNSLLRSLRIMFPRPSMPFPTPPEIHRDRIIIIIIIIIVFVVSISTRYNISVPIHRKTPQPPPPPTVEAITAHQENQRFTAKFRSSL